jgi:hypothetical protein
METTPAESLPLEVQDDQQLVAIVRGLGPPAPFNTKGPSFRFGARHKKWFLQFLEACPSPTMAARVMGCSVSLLYKHKRLDEQFRDDWNRIMEQGREMLLAAAHEEALGFGLRHVLTKNAEGEHEVIAIPKERNDKLLAVAMQFWYPNKHQHQVEVNDQALPPGTVTIQITPAQLRALSKQERQQLGHLIDRIEQASQTPVIEHQTHDG